MIFACNCRDTAGVSSKEAQTVIPATFKLLTKLDHYPLLSLNLSYIKAKKPQINPKKAQHTKLYLYHYFRNISVVAF